jgi:hypothetical protein
VRLAERRAAHAQGAEDVQFEVQLNAARRATLSRVASGASYRA